jgi:hypothetical protein
MLVEIPGHFRRARVRNSALGLTAAMDDTVGRGLFCRTLPCRFLTNLVQIDDVTHGLTRRQPDACSPGSASDASVPFTPIRRHISRLALAYCYSASVGQDVDVIRP